MNLEIEIKPGKTIVGHDRKTEHSVQLRVKNNDRVVEYLCWTYDRKDVASFRRARANAEAFNRGFVTCDRIRKLSPGVGKLYGLT